MQHTGRSNNRQVFRAPCQMNWEGSGSIYAFKGSMAEEATAQETRKIGQGPWRKEGNGSSKCAVHCH